MLPFLARIGVADARTFASAETFARILMGLEVSTRCSAGIAGTGGTACAPLGPRLLPGAGEPELLDEEVDADDDPLKKA